MLSDKPALLYPSSRRPGMSKCRSPNSCHRYSFSKAAAYARSIVSRPARPSTRARSQPQRTSSPSLDVRWERPQARRTIASSRLVLPAAFGPTISWGPGPKLASSERYDRRSRMLIVVSSVACAASVREVMAEASLRRSSGAA